METGWNTKSTKTIKYIVLFYQEMVFICKVLLTETRMCKSDTNWGFGAAFRSDSEGGLLMIAWQSTLEVMGNK